MPSTTTNHLVDTLHKTPLFAALDQESLAQLAGAATLMPVPRGTMIVQEGEKAKGLHLVVEGLVKISHISPEGQELVMHLIRPGNLFGEAAVFQQSTYPASAVAENNCRIVFIPAEKLFALIQNKPELALAMLEALSARLRLFARKVEAAHDRNALERLAAYLCHRLQIKPGSNTITLDVSQETLGSMLGIRRETLSRMLSQLESDGLVAKDKKQLTVLDAQGLAAIFGGLSADE